MDNNPHPFWVTIHGARGDEWERVAGTRTFPVLSPIPVNANLPEIGEAQVFLLSLLEIDAKVAAAIILHLARKFQLSGSEVMEELQSGIPILAADCTVIVRNLLNGVSPNA